MSKDDHIEELQKAVQAMSTANEYLDMITEEHPRPRQHMKLARNQLALAFKHIMQVFTDLVVEDEKERQHASIQVPD